MHRAFTIGVTVLALLSTTGVIAAAPGTEINSYHPLFLFDAPGEDALDEASHFQAIYGAWNSLPEDLKPYAVLNIRAGGSDPSLWTQRFVALLPQLQDAEIPVALTLATGEPGAIFPWDELRTLSGTYTSIRGVHVEGLRFTTYPAQGNLDPALRPGEIDWLTGVMEMAGQSGRFVTLQLPDLNLPRLMSNVWCESLYKTMVKYKDNIIPLTDPHGPHRIIQHASAMGLWLEGAVTNWGVSSGSQWYSEANLIEPGVFGNTTDSVMPTALYRAMSLLGALSGATVYRFENPEDLWTGPNRYQWDQAIKPVLTEMVSNTLIARTDQVLQKTKVAYRLNTASKPDEFNAIREDIDGLFYNGLMATGVYGQDIPGQMPEIIPNTGRYYWIPILSPYTSDETLRQFEEVLLPGALVDAPSWRTRLDPYYIPDGTGPAYITKTGRNYFVLHTQENLYEEQSYSLTAAPAPLGDVQANREGNAISVSWPFREGDVSYTVLRALNPLSDPPMKNEFQELANGIDLRSYKDEGIQSSDSVVYAVSALTNERAPLEGTVNFGDYLVISSAHSLITTGAHVRPYTVQSVSTPITTANLSSLPKEQLWWDDLRHATGNMSAIGHAISNQIIALGDAFQRGDINALINVYAPNYTDSDGLGRGYVAKLFQSYFEGYKPGQMERQIRSWNFDDLEFNNEVHVTLYCRFTGLKKSSHTFEESSIVHSFPSHAGSQIQLTFTLSNTNEWLIRRSDPPLPNLEDVFP